MYGDPDSRAAANVREDIAIDHRDYEDESVIAIGFGPGIDDSRDILGEMIIVVAGDRQFE